MAGTHGSMAATHGLNDSQSVGVQGVDHDCPAAPTLDPMTESDCCCTVTVIASDVAQKLLNPAILIAIPYVIDTFEAKPPSEDGFAFENVRTLARSPPVYLVTQRVRI